MKTVLLIGATRGIGRLLALEYARRGAHVHVTGTDPERAAAEIARTIVDEAALPESLPPRITGLGLDPAGPDGVEKIDGVEKVDRLAVVAPVAAAARTVVRALRPRLSADASILLFGSATAGPVDAAVAGLVRAMSVELAPVRVNAIHPGHLAPPGGPFSVGDPSLAGGTLSAAELDRLDVARRRTLTGRLGDPRDVVDGCLFLLENPLADGVDLTLDGGRR